MLTSKEANKKFEYYQNMRKGQLFKLVTVKIKKNVSEVQISKKILWKSDLFCSFRAWVADIKFPNIEPDLGPFQSVMKFFYFKFGDAWFFKVEIFTKTTQTNHEIANILKHDQIATSRRTANLSRDIKHAMRSLYVGFLGANIPNCSKF